MQVRLTRTLAPWMRLSLAALLLMNSAPLRAQEDRFPTKPISVVIGSSSGSSMEFEMRILQPKFREILGQTLQIDLRPGANGAIGATHVLPLKKSATAEQAKAEEAGNDILKLCVEVGGCLTGEHGVGIEKRDLMRFQFSPVDLDQQMRVRAVFDPGWLLNPAKVFPLDQRDAA